MKEHAKYKHGLDRRIGCLVTVNRGPQRRARHESSSKSNLLHIELSFPIRVRIDGGGATRNSWRDQIRRQNIFTSLNCQRHCAPRLNPRPAFSIRFVCPYGTDVSIMFAVFKVASFAAIAGLRVFPLIQAARYNWLFLMTVSLSRWRGIVTGLVSKFNDGVRR